MLFTLIEKPDIVINGKIIGRSKENPDTKENPDATTYDFSKIFYKLYHIDIEFNENINTYI